jgi:hypothetical protein
LSWNEVIERLRAFERYRSIWPTAAANLRLVVALRKDPRLADLGRNVSHVSVLLWRPDRPGHVAIVWSEPDGWGWSGRTGFRIDRLAGPVDSFEHVIVPKRDVIEAVLALLFT